MPAAAAPTLGTVTPAVAPGTATPFVTWSVMTERTASANAGEAASIELIRYQVSNISLP